MLVPCGPCPPVRVRIGKQRRQPERQHIATSSVARARGVLSVSYRYESVCVVGLGYIGLPTAAALAARKIMVIGVDIHEGAVQTINQGRIHIVEPDLDILVHAVVTEGYLRATTRPEAADAFIIAVP